jgi:hypothetical protein
MLPSRITAPQLVVVQESTVGSKRFVAEAEPAAIHIAAAADAASNRLSMSKNPLLSLSPSQGENMVGRISSGLRIGARFALRPISGPEKRESFLTP